MEILDNTWLIVCWWSWFICKSADARFICQASLQRLLFDSLCWLQSVIGRTFWSNSASSWTGNWISFHLDAFQERLTHIWTCSSNLIMSLAAWSSVVSAAERAFVPASRRSSANLIELLRKRRNYGLLQRLVSSKQAWSAEPLSMTTQTLSTSSIKHWKLMLCFWRWLPN